MEGFFPCLPLNPLHPRADGDALAAGLKKQILCSNDPGLENLSLELLHSWISPKEFAIAYLQSRPLISVACLPARLLELLAEARKCIGFGLSEAAVALGRMMLEVALTDIGERIGRIPKLNDLASPYHDYPPGARADILFGKSGPRRQRFRMLYDLGSQTIHSTSDSRLRAVAYVNDVVVFIGNEYTIHRHLLALRGE